MNATWVMPPKGDIVDYLAAHPDLVHDDLVAIENASPMWSPGEEAETPNEPDAVFATPTAPIESLPPAFAQYVNDAAKATGVPPEMIALPMMQFVGALVGNRAYIRMKRTFVQMPTLWVAIVADPGSAKSPALNLARWPFDVLQREATDLYKRLVAEWEDDVERWTKTDPDERGSKPIRPRHRDIYTTNATLEAVVGALETTPGLTIFRDELIGFITSLDQYRGGKGSDRQEYLSAWSGAPIKVNRRTGEPVFLPWPVVGMSGGIVTDNVAQLHDKKGNRDGLFERFIMIRCRVTPQAWTDDDLDPALLDPILVTLRELDGIAPRDGQEGGLCIQPHQDAREVWRDWFGENSRLQGEATGMARGFYAKLSLMVPRIALVLNLLWNPQNPGALVSAERMADACEWGEFIRTHFHAVMPLVNESGAARVGGLESRVLRILRNPELQESDGYVPRRTILQRLGNVKADDLTVALGKLRANGRVESLVEPTVTKPRESWRIITASVVDFPRPRRYQATGTDGPDLEDGDVVF